MLSETAEAMVALDRIAKIIGRLLSVDLGVEESGDRLVFVDENDDPITNDGEEIIAATRQEIEAKDVAEFAVRALRAAGIAKYQAIERSRNP